MAKKSPHKNLQRLTEDEIGKRPQLTFCHNLMAQNPRRDGENGQQWAARVFLENKQALIVSAERKAAYDDNGEE